MKQELKYPARCSCIPAEEQQLISGGAPAWVENLKEKLKPYQPDWDLVWEGFLTGMACISSLYEILVETKTVRDAIKNIIQINT